MPTQETVSSALVWLICSTWASVVVAWTMTLPGAWRLAQAPAQAGDPYARYLVAKLPERGLRGAMEIEKGKTALRGLVGGPRREARKKDIHCQSALAYALDAVLEDYESAVIAYRECADAGLLVAMNNLGGYYSNGKGLLTDSTKANSWKEKARKAGYNG